MTTPEDIDAFLFEVETRAGKATPGPWHQGYVDKERIFAPYNEGLAGYGGKRVVFLVNMHFQACHDDAQFVAHAREDIPRLVAIVREREVERAHWRRATGCMDPATIEIALGRLYDVAECKPPCDGIPDGIVRIKAERDALRDRLAKLEAVARRACECDACAISRELWELLEAKDVTP